MSDAAPWSYLPCSRPTTGPTPWCREAIRVLAQLDPGGRSAGCYNRRRVRDSQDAWSLHACGRAVDWHPESRVRGRELADWIAWFGAPDVQLIIYDGRQWGGTRGPVWHPYHGSDPHVDHIHIESRSATPRGSIAS